MRCTFNRVTWRRTLGYYHWIRSTTNANKQVSGYSSGRRDHHTVQAVAATGLVEPVEQEENDFRSATIKQQRISGIATVAH